MDTTALFQHLKTPIENFYHWERTTPDAIFLRQPFGKEWKSYSYSQVGQLARKMAQALYDLGLEKGDHVGILSKNCCQWIVADIAIMLGGFVSVPFYASLQGEQLKQVIINSEIKVLFAGKLEFWGEETHPIPKSVQIIKFPHYKGNAIVDQGLEWDDLITKSKPLENVIIPDLEDLWTILYTSGTTGIPKGVMHTYKNPALVIRGEKLTNYVGIFTVPKQKYFSFLPLNHVGERIGTQVNCLATGGMISFGESIDSFIYNVQDTQPTSFFAVPRIWTKFYEGVTAKVPQKKLDLFFKIPVLSSIVKKKIRIGLGLNEAKIVATGAAITPAYLKKFYKELGIHLIEGYGMTEVCGGISYGVDRNTPHDSVGKTVPFCEIKIEPSTGEILMKAPYMMKGYYKDPVHTAEVLKDGWMHSGDRGEIDQNGFVKVLGRVNDAFKTAKGEFVVPNPIEGEFEKNEFVEFVCVCGLTSPQPLAMITLSEVSSGKNITEIENALLQTLQEVNNKAASHEKISTIVVHTEPWSEFNGLLTPTMKIRRGNIDKVFRDKYLSWHDSSQTIIWE
jgi:long-chain acyl-CoA synthetase